MFNFGSNPNVKRHDSTATVYPVGCFVDGKGPGGELVRYVTPEEAVLVHSPLAEIVAIFRRPLSMEVACKALDAAGHTDSTMDEMMEAGWLLSVEAQDAADLSGFAGYALVPNMASAEPKENFSLTVTASTSGQKASMSSITAQVLKLGLTHDTPSAAKEVLHNAGLPMSVLSETLLSEIPDLILTGNVYLMKLVD